MTVVTVKANNIFQLMTVNLTTFIKEFLMHSPIQKGRFCYNGVIFLLCMEKQLNHQLRWWFIIQLNILQ